MAKRIETVASDKHRETSSKQVSAQQALLGRTIYLLADTLRIMGILLQPFMPDKSAEMLDILGVSTQKRTFEYAALGKDCSYGRPKIDIGRDAHAGLFPPLEVED